MLGIHSFGVGFLRRLNEGKRGFSLVIGLDLGNMQGVWAYEMTTEAEKVLPRHFCFFFHL